MIETVLAPFIWIVSTLFSVVWWILWQLIWIAVWLLLPVAVVAFIALKIAERVFGVEPVRAWLRTQAAHYGGTLGGKLSRGLLALSILPFRVIAWFVVYAVWHAAVSLFWRPRWSPWQRAWAKRWKGDGTHAAAAKPRRA